MYSVTKKGTAVHLCTNFATFFARMSLKVTESKVCRGVAHPQVAQQGYFTLDLDLSVIKYFLRDISQTRLENAVEICNLALDLAEIWMW